MEVPPPRCDLGEYIASFLAAPAKPSSRRRRACWLDADKEAAFLHQALAEYKRAIYVLLQEPPVTATPPSSIPRILHHIWLGSPFPARFQSFRASWLEHHPAKDGWTHVLWTDAEVAPLLDSLRNKQAYLAAPNYGQKADILRYELLQRHGGIYMDVDMECVRSLDGLHGQGGPAFYTGFSITGTVELNNGLIGAVPQHPLLANLIERIHAEHSKPTLPPPPLPSPPPSTSSSQVHNMAAILGFLGQGEAAAVKQAVEAGERTQAAMDTIEATGPGLFTRVVAEHLLLLQQAAHKADENGSETIILAPPEWFYPMPNHVAVADASSSLSSSSSSSFVVPGVTYAVHHWARSWQQQQQKPPADASAS